MRAFHPTWTMALAFFALLASPVLTTPAHAGCGCDHPPPAWAPVMPAFGPPGTAIVLNAQSGEFVPGAEYTVEFNGGSWSTIDLTVAADSVSSLAVNLPFVFPGPTKIEVDGPGYSHVYEEHLFTTLALPRKVPAGDAVMMLNDLSGAVSEDGVLMFAIDLSDVADATQFAFVVANEPLRFGEADVVFYNADGVDLTLFTLAVDDPTERQWGSYYGWDVETDSGITATMYDTQVMDSLDPDKQSDLLTYWRHEFHTYKAAHAVGGSHGTNEAGYHPDGTRHVDHDTLVIAIDTRGFLSPGHAEIDLLVDAVVAENPVEPSAMVDHVPGSDVWVEKNGMVTDLLMRVLGRTSPVGLTKQNPHASQPSDSGDDD